MIHTGCPVRFHPTHDDQFEVTFGSPRHGFEMLFTRDSLRELVTMATGALALPTVDAERDTDDLATSTRCR